MEMAEQPSLSALPAELAVAVKVLNRLGASLSGTQLHAFAVALAEPQMKLWILEADKAPKVGPAKALRKIERAARNLRAACSDLQAVHLPTYERLANRLIGAEDADTISEARHVVADLGIEAGNLASAIETAPDSSLGTPHIVIIRELQNIANDHLALTEIPKSHSPRVDNASGPVSEFIQAVFAEWSLEAPSGEVLKTALREK